MQTPEIGKVELAAEFLRVQLADWETQWSIGSFGALAEFSRKAEEKVMIERTDRGLSALTDRGGIRISLCPAIRLAASESITRKSWSHRVAVCLHKSKGSMAQRNVLTLLGPDRDALRESDREKILFDLGLGIFQVDACIRVSDPSVISELQGLTGRNVFEVGNPAMSIVVPNSPHRVFVSQIGRLEVFQPIPPPSGRSPEGPHTHVLPNLLRHQRTHASTEKIPDGFVPCAHLYPAHPAKDDLGHVFPFDEGRHTSFQHILQRFGDKNLVGLKQHVMHAIERGAEPSTVTVPNDRHARATVRVALRQLQASRRSLPMLLTWLQAYDPSHIDSSEIEDAETIHMHS